MFVSQDISIVDRTKRIETNRKKTHQNRWWMVDWGWWLEDGLVACGWSLVAGAAGGWWLVAGSHGGLGLVAGLVAGGWLLVADG